MTEIVEIERLREAVAKLGVSLATVRSYQAVSNAQATAGYQILRDSAEILVNVTETLTGTPTISLPSSPSVQDRVEILRSGGVDLTETVTSSVLSADSLTRFEWNGTVWISAVLGGSSAGGTDDQTAAEVPFTPAGDIAATDVQAAIEELDAEKLAVGAQAADADTVDGQHAAAFATAAQGATADTALQPGDIASGTITARADDIDFSGGSDGNVLTVQADGSLAIEALPAAGAFALPDATDVTITAVGTGELLTYTGAEWENQTLAEAGIQPLDAELSALAGLTSAADALPYFTGSGTAAVTTLSAYARGFLDDADEATLKATLNLETGVDVQAWDADLDKLAAVTLAANQAPVLNSAGAAVEARTQRVIGAYSTTVTANGTYPIALWGPIPTTLAKVSARTVGGTCSIEIQKGGVAINGFGTPIALTTSITDTPSTETLAEDAVLTVIVTSAGSLTGIYITFKGVRTGD